MLQNKGDKQKNIPVVATVLQKIVSLLSPVHDEKKKCHKNYLKIALKVNT